MKRIFTLILVGWLLAGLVAGCNDDDGDSDTASAPTTMEGAAGSAADEVGATPPDAGAEAGVAGEDPMASVATVDVPSGVIASVNGQELSLGEFQRQAFEAQHYYVERGVDPNTSEGQQQLLFVRRQVLTNMINQALIEQSAAERGITVSDEELDERMAQFVADFGGEEKLSATLAEDGSTMDDVRQGELAAMIAQRLFEEEIYRGVGENVEFAHARHILCDERSPCEAALARIRAGEGFAAVAADVSQDDNTKGNGGDLDWMARGTAPSQAFDDVLFSTPVGQVSDVFESEYGYQIIEVLERDDDREVSEDLLYRLREKALEDWLSARRSESRIEIFVDDLADVIEP